MSGGEVDFSFPMATFWAMVIVYYFPPGNISFPSLPVSALLNFPFRGILPKCYGYFCILLARLHVSGSDSSCSSPIFHKHFSEFTEAREITYFTTCLDCIPPLGQESRSSPHSGIPSLPSLHGSLPFSHFTLHCSQWSIFGLFFHCSVTPNRFRVISRRSVSVILRMCPSLVYKH